MKKLSLAATALLLCVFAAVHADVFPPIPNPLRFPDVANTDKIILYTGYGIGIDGQNTVIFGNTGAGVAFKAASNSGAQWGIVDTNGIGSTPVAFSAISAACVSGNEGRTKSVTDSTTNVWGATITGGGANHALAYCDGTNWTVAAK